VWPTKRKGFNNEYVLPSVVSAVDASSEYTANVIFQDDSVLAKGKQRKFKIRNL